MIIRMGDDMDGLMDDGWIIIYKYTTAKNKRRENVITSPYSTAN